MLAFREEDHVYTWNGNAVPNVTSIIEKAYDFRFVNPDALERARKLGKKVHKTTEMYDLGVLREETLHPVLQKYLASWLQFREENNVEVIACEKLGYSEKYGFAGTIDRIITMNGDGPFIADIKTGEQYVPHELQSAGYKLIAINNFWCDNKVRRCSIYLYDDGYEIKMHNDPMDEAAFLALLTFKKYMDRKNGKRS